MDAPIGEPVATLPAKSAAPSAPATPAPSVPAPTAAPAQALTPAPAINMQQAGKAVHAWASLIEGGCDPKGGDTHVWTPVEARILRNVPFAMRGYTFNSPELAAYFNTAERNWYEASTTDVNLPEPVTACVNKLKAWEEELRKEWPVPPEAEARILRDPATFAALWDWGHASAEKTYDLVLVQPSADGISVQLMAPGCDPQGDCSAYVIECPKEGDCVAIAAG